MKLAIALTACLFVPGVSGCSGDPIGADPETTSATAAPATSDAPGATTTQPATTTTTQPAAYSISPVEFETPEGWAYLFSPSIPGPYDLALRKSISDSPPGEARLYIDAVISPASDFAIPNTPGRNAPDRYFPLRVVYFPFQSSGFVDALAIAGKSMNGTYSNGFKCRVIGSDHASWEYRREAHTPLRDDLLHSGNGGVICEVTDIYGYQVSPSKWSGWLEGDESVIDAVIAETVSDPALFFSIGGRTVGYCEIQVFPNGEVSIGSSITEGKCG